MPLAFGGTSAKVTCSAAAVGAVVAAGCCWARGAAALAKGMMSESKQLIIRRTTLSGRLSTSGLRTCGLLGARRRSVRTSRSALRFGLRQILLMLCDALQVKLLLLFVEPRHNGLLALGVRVALELVIEPRQHDVRRRMIR